MMFLFIDTFPVLDVFYNLDMPENVQLAKKVLNGLSGIYGVVHIPTGTCYIGSSQDLGLRIMDHIQNHSSNLHLQYAIAKYGLSSFAFVILQYCIPSDLLKCEQHFLDILFYLAKELRYNFLQTAGSSLGVVRSEETRAKMSSSQQLVDRSGALNPRYGKVAANAITIDVYDLDNVLVCSFTSQVEAANWLKILRITLQRYHSSGKVWNNQYTFRKSSSSKS
jgi:hypothetical protein